MGPQAFNALCRGVVKGSAARPCPQAIYRSLLACGTAWTRTVEELSLAPASGIKSTAIIIKLADGG